ncbi:MAG: hypothetical protein ACYC4U_22535 [Pirellulaceae bacterium]
MCKQAVGQQCAWAGKQPTGVGRSRGLLLFLPLMFIATGALHSDPAASSPVADQGPLLAEPFETPRQLLRLLDVDDSDWNSFHDGHPMRPDDQEALLKILYRMPQIGWEEIERWQREPESWDALSANPSAMRGEFFDVRGRVRSITSQSLLPRLAALFDFEHYFEVQLETSAPPGMLTIFTRTVPDAWRHATTLDERAGASALFLKAGPQSDGATSLLFAAPRIAWFPDRVGGDFDVDPQQVWLAELGMDIGLFDQVRARNRLPLGADERECFYALLSAVSRAEGGELSRRAQPASLASLLQQPEQHQGQILNVQGKVRRITKVVVDEPDIRERFGISSYFQLDVMVPVGNQTIEIRGARDQAAGPVYRNVFPFTYCAVRLPRSWEPLVGEPHVSRLVEMNGVFLKLWAFSNPLVAALDERQQQLSPMFVVDEPSDPESSDRSTSWSGIALGLGCLLCLVIVGTILWRMNHADRMFAAKRRGPQRSSATAPRFDDVEVPPSA